MRKGSVAVLRDRVKRSPWGFRLIQETRMVSSTPLSSRTTVWHCKTLPGSRKLLENPHQPWPNGNRRVRFSVNSKCSTSRRMRSDDYAHLLRGAGHVATTARGSRTGVCWDRKRHWAVPGNDGGGLHSPGAHGLSAGGSG